MYMYGYCFSGEGVCMYMYMYNIILCMCTSLHIHIHVYITILCDEKIRNTHCVEATPNQLAVSHPPRFSPYPHVFRSAYAQYRSILLQFWDWKTYDFDDHFQPSLWFCRPIPVTQLFWLRMRNYKLIWSLLY